MFKHTHRFLKRKISIAAIALFAIGSFAFIADDNLFEISKHLDIFSTLFKEVNIYYVDETDPEKLSKKAIDVMLESLDPYTEYYQESDLEDYKMRYVSTEYGGIGALVQNRDGHIIVSEPYEEFPAQKGGLLAGDELLEVDGKSTKNAQVSEVSEKLKGKPGTKVKIVIKRQGLAKPIEKVLTREEIKFGNIIYTGTLNNGKVGYIKLDKFLSESYNEFRSAFQGLKKQGIESLIIDLRGNGGGILQEAVQIVNLFVDRGELIVSQKGKIKEMNASYKAESEPLDKLMPLAVLIDTATASASEITSGAIQDLDRGVVIGQRSFGKGLVQQTKQLPYHAQLKVTVAKYYTPSGRCVQAINYAKKEKNGKVKVVPDSLISEYSTKGGRKVYDGSGIYPDIKTEVPEFSHLTVNLLSNNLIFDFATQYRVKHSSIKPAKDFSLTEEEYKEFCDYVKSQKFTYVTDSEEKLKAIKKAAQDEKYFEKAKQEFDKLEAKIGHNVDHDLQFFKTEIKEVLENEIVSRYYFQKGRMESLLFNYDVEVKEALRILADKQLYQSILKGEGTFQSIGAPPSKLKGSK